MNKYSRLVLGAASLGMVAASSAGAFAADPIVGNWMTKAGTMAKISGCGSSYCIRITSGPFAGKPIGKMSGSGGNYTGQIKDPENNRTYSGKAAIKGSKLHLTGCRAKVFCRTQKWTRR